MSEPEEHSLAEQEALAFHSEGRPGKIEIVATKPMATQRDLALAYSPGVAVPVRAIAANPDRAYDYTAKGNLVAVITNGTAILGLGNLGALASKPVLEGKAVLFKRFADVDAIDLELATENVETFIAAVEVMEPSFGGINLEDIKAPECFVIERTLRARMNIPVFHDDQHGTAVIMVAGLINALHLTGRRIEDVKMVVNGAGAAALACTDLAKAVGVPPSQVILCDSKGVVYEGRNEGMNEWKAAHAVDTKDRTLADAMRGADLFLGLSVEGAVTREMVASMAERPIIFALANPNPEITPEEVKAVRADAIIATGRSDYPNQINNVLGFPYIFRGALDVRATTINEEMKLAAAQAIADLARRRVPEEVAAAYGGVAASFGPEYLIPAPFDPRLIEEVPLAVARAAMASGVARRPIADERAYRSKLKARLDPTAAVLATAHEEARANPKRVIFTEAEEQSVLRAAIAFREEGYGTPVLVGHTEGVRAALATLGCDSADFEIENARTSPLVPDMIERLYARLCRSGYLRRDCVRLVHQDRNVFGALLLDMGFADAMLTGTTRHFHETLDKVGLVIATANGCTPFGVHMAIGRGRIVFIADTTVSERPTAESLALVAEQTALIARRMGQVPRVAFLSFSTFGNPHGEWLENTRGAVALLDARETDFEYEGEMSADVALNPEMRRHYPFNRLTEPANILIMPGLQSGNISAKLLRELGGGSVLGPFLVGMAKPVQIAAMTSSVSDLLMLAVLAATGIMR
jgi:malate dehydrogenase (oxaloacetate-decarboxylating)(NADP+)